MPWKTEKLKDKVVASVQVSSMGQTDLFKNYSHLTVFEKTLLLVIIESLVLINWPAEHWQIFKGNIHKLFSFSCFNIDSLKVYHLYSDDTRI